GDQPAAGGDPRRRRHREAAHRGRGRGWQRLDRHQDHVLLQHLLRPPSGRRSRRRPLHARPQEGPRAGHLDRARSVRVGTTTTWKSATSPEESGLVVSSGYGFWYAFREVSFMALLKDSERLI